jgi:threonine/homoserine/homoserine lactone efflux protein
MTLFLTAAVLLAITPGPGMLYVLARTLAGGRREGVLSSLGTFAGGLIHVLAGAAGLSMILATSAVAFTVVKYAGAAYLMYLGVRMIVTARREEVPFDVAASNSPFWQGIATEALNPKTALFFLSFIPQFVDRAHGNVFAQFLLLGSISVTLNTSADLIVVLLAGPIGKRLRQSVTLRRLQRQATGVTLIALGAYVAAADSH